MATQSDIPNTTEEYDDLLLLLQFGEDSVPSRSASMISCIDDIRDDDIKFLAYSENIVRLLPAAASGRCPVLGSQGIVSQRR